VADKVEQSGPRPVIRGEFVAKASPEVDVPQYSIAKASVEDRARAIADNIIGRIPAEKTDDNEDSDEDVAIG